MLAKDVLMLKLEYTRYKQRENSLEQSKLKVTDLIEGALRAAWNRTEDTSLYMSPS